MVSDWAHLFRGHIFGFLERRTKTGGWMPKGVFGGARYFVGVPWLETLRSVCHECMLQVSGFLTLNPRLVPPSMTNAAKCDTSCELQNNVNH